MEPRRPKGSPASERPLVERFVETRRLTEQLAEPLTSEDQQVQSMPLASPTKWHRAHTTWFLEEFILRPAGVAPYHPRFSYLFNSYYEEVGPRVDRSRRGMLTRPSAREVGEYRRAVDQRVLRLLEGATGPLSVALAQRLELGLHHEQQHQELILTDMLHAFFENPLAPVYRPGSVPSVSGAALAWHTLPGGLFEIGAASEGFAFDNERPRHRVFIEPYAIASRPCTVGELKAFIAERGYSTPSLWLTDGFALAQAQKWNAPLYAKSDGDGFRVFSLRGWRAPSDDEPASHLSFWEADALARFLGGRLLTEAEWELAAEQHASDVGNFSDGPLVPRPSASGALGQLFGDVWEWTRSAYEPYPGFRPAPGALGEYNAKFMAQQYVLRGGSCLTPRGHLRASYRNFWHPDTRFQMTGARLARDA